MSNPSVGAVDIELIANLVKFKLGMTEAGKTVEDFGSNSSRKFKEASEKARQSLDLISDSVGVRLPRELKSLIAQIPGLNTALAGALGTAAFAAVIAVVGEAVAKFVEYQQAVKEANDKWHEFLTSNLADQNKQRDALEESVLKLRSAGDAVAELRGKLQEMRRDISALSPEVEKFAHAFEEALKPQSKTDTWLGYLQAVLNNTAPQLADALDGLRNHASELTDEARRFHDELNKTALAPGGTANALKLIDDRLSNVYQRLQAAPKDEGLLKFKDDLEALQKSFSTEATKKYYDQLNLVREASRDVTQGVQELRDKLAGLVSDNDPIGQLNEKFRKVEQELRKSAADNGTIFKAAFPNDSIETVIASVEKLKRSLIDGELAKGAQDAGKAIKESLEGGFKSLSTLTITPPLPTLAPNAQAPTSLEKTLEQLNSQDPAAVQKATAEEARKVADAVETQNQKYEENLALVAKLQAAGVISAEQAKQYKNLIDPVAQSWRNFGQEVGDTTRDALLFGRSWSDALKSLLFDLLKVIAQMTILKTLQQSAAGGGIGGFFSNILGGLLGGGHAQGGHVNPNTIYPVGEDGVEMFRPDVAGTIVPNSALGGRTSGDSTVYNIDARGATPGTEDRIRRAIQDSENRAVVRSVHAVNDLQRRR